MGKEQVEFLGRQAESLKKKIALEQHRLTQVQPEGCCTLLEQELFLGTLRPLPPKTTLTTHTPLIKGVEFHPLD